MIISPEHEALFADTAQRGSRIYEESLKTLLEPEHNGKAVAIHVDTGEYIVADSLPLAREKMHQDQPDGMLFSRTIGIETTRPFFSGCWRGESTKHRDERYASNR